MSRSSTSLFAALFVSSLAAGPAPAADRLVVEAEPSACTAVDQGLIVADDELVGAVLFCEKGSPVGSCRTAKLKYDKAAKAEDPESKGLPPVSKLAALQDFEGLATEGTNVYLVGSHNGSEREEKTNKKGEKKVEKSKRRFDREFLLEAEWKFKKDNRTGDLEIVAAQYALFDIILTKIKDHLAEKTGLLADDPDYSQLNVEGLALCGNQLYLGLRSPLDQNGKAMILSAPPKEWFEKQPKIDVSLVELGKGVGVRALDCAKEGLVILSGGATDDSELPSSLWTYRPGKDDHPTLVRLADADLLKPPSGNTGIAEGVCAIGDGKSVVVSDPGAVGGADVRVVDWPD